MMRSKRSCTSRDRKGAVIIPDKFHEECGVVAVFGHPEAAKLAYLGLYALQHRGQENAGIVSSDGGRLLMHKGDGLVADVFTQAVLDSLPGRNAIGHVRYSTTGSNVSANAQPLLANYHGGVLALAQKTTVPALLGVASSCIAVVQAGVPLRAASDGSWVEPAQE